MLAPRRAPHGCTCAVGRTTKLCQIRGAPHHDAVRVTALGGSSMVYALTQQRNQPLQTHLVNTGAGRCG
jgi:hypothetical protein